MWQSWDWNAVVFDSILKLSATTFNNLLDQFYVPMTFLSIGNSGIDMTYILNNFTSLCSYVWT